MARKRRAAAAAAGPTPAAETAAAPQPASPAPAPVSGLPGEVTRDDWTVPIFALMMALAPAVGVPHEEMLQDTLKSIIVSTAALGAAMLFLLQVRGRAEPLRWHGILWLPIALMAYALGSMVWSHTYLGGVEAVRWFVFALIAWLGLNTMNRERLPMLAWGIHAGATVASLWAVLQFLLPSFGLFPQGPNPASTFVNRNFFAEFVVCTLPFGWLLLTRARMPAMVAILAASSGLVVVSILMTGTRAALMAMWLQVLVVLPLMAWRCRDRLGWGGWSGGMRSLAAAAFLVTVGVLGAIPSQNAKILEEERGRTGIERGLLRTASIRPDDESLGTRMIMWQATMRVIADRPVTGVGAGAWEARIPLYQTAGSQLETDYYVHNEYLQLMAEYGLVGWVFLLLLFAYLVAAGRRVWRSADPPEQDEQVLRAVFLCSLLALLVVSNVGFPWRMASTGALFALCLAGLAASVARLGYSLRVLALPLRWSPRIALGALAVNAVAIGLALAITWQAAECERKLVRAAKIALTLTASGRPLDPSYAKSRDEMLQLAREGIAINPHYRKITPIIADELGRWGDWANAIWIWDSVLSSRPYVVAIISNVARGYSSIGEHAKAWAYLERARRLQPDAPAVRSLEVVLLSRRGDEPLAMALARRTLAEGRQDQDLVNALAILAWRAKDFDTAVKALALRAAEWPESRPRAYLQLGVLYAQELKDPARALDYFRRSLAAAAPQDRPAVLQQVPAEYRSQLAAPAAGAASAAQTSSSKR